ncbi:hypothetical protein OG985_15250 [Streptomyces sp. NBC_00289]|uniref:hypothetical protein n=1 Tax=Streptomyces sp. NBC_00289 TaxID=2975703 RepID=UPI00324B1A6E
MAPNRRLDRITDENDAGDDKVDKAVKDLDKAVSDYNKAALNGENPDSGKIDAAADELKSVCSS